MKSLLLALLSLPIFLTGCYTTVRTYHPRRGAHVERDYHHRHNHHNYDRDRYDRGRAGHYNHSRDRYHHKSDRRVNVNTGVYY